MGRRKKVPNSILIAASVSNRLLLGKEFNSETEAQHLMPNTVPDPVPQSNHDDLQSTINSSEDSEDEEKLSPDYEREVVANETAWKIGRVDIQRELLLRSVPSFINPCQCCGIGISEVYCRTCDALHCYDCCHRIHETQFCHDLNRANTLVGLEVYSSPLKTITDCSPYCTTPNKTISIRLVDLKGLLPLNE